MFSLLVISLLFDFDVLCFSTYGCINKSLTLPYFEYDLLQNTVDWFCCVAPSTSLSWQQIIVIVMGAVIFLLIIFIIFIVTSRRRPPPPATRVAIIKSVYERSPWMPGVRSKFGPPRHGPLRWSPLRTFYGQWPELWLCVYLCRWIVDVTHLRNPGQYLRLTLIYVLLCKHFPIHFFCTNVYAFTAFGARRF